MEEYPDLFKRALRTMTTFTTKYLREVVFSVLAEVKTKHHQRMDADKEQRIKLLKIAPNFAKLFAKMQTTQLH